MSHEPMKCCVRGCFKMLPVSSFGTDPRTADGLAAMCAVCSARRVQISRHGLTSADKAEMAATQDGCAICGRPEPSAKGWVVDHDRACCPGDKSCADCRRGILCAWCNTALGYAQDSPEILRRMADYLELGVRLVPPNRTPIWDPNRISDSEIQRT